MEVTTILSLGIAFIAISQVLTTMRVNRLSGHVDMLMEGELKRMAKQVGRELNELLVTLSKEHEKGEEGKDS